jgi:hypothetical protein
LFGGVWDSASFSFGIPLGGVVMSALEPSELLRRLRELNATLAGTTSDDLRASPDLAAEAGRLVELLADRDVLAGHGYYDLGQACGKICDAFQEGEPPRMRAFSHCGESHPYHALQTYVTCPVCRQYRAKTRGFFGQDGLEEVAGAALRWLGIDWKTVPGWNLACDPRVSGHEPDSTTKSKDV